MTAVARVGWCPGALRPMQSGDGLLVRVKPHCATLTFEQAAGLAALAARCGNGQIDLTGRANLQIRGVSEASQGDLTAGLDQLGLLDPDPESESVRNIVASPLAGLDLAATDIRPIVAALEQRLLDDPACRRLPPKFAMVVDDGGPLSLDAVAADLRFVCQPSGPVLLGLGGAWAAIDREQVADALSHVAALVARHRPERMRSLVEAVGGKALLTATGLRAAAARPIQRPNVSMENLLGTHERHTGVAPRFGSLRPQDLKGLVETARRAGAQDLRLTPWRVLLVTPPVIARRSSGRSDPRSVSELDRRAPLATTAHGAALEGDLAALGLITRPMDPHLGIVACVGAPGCRRATVATRADAARLAGLLAPSPTIQVHVAGCAKGCAKPSATSWTLVGQDGRYDLVRDGSAADEPVARGLSVLAAAARVRGGGRAPLGST